MSADADIRYVILLSHEEPALMTRELVAAHVRHLEELEDAGLLELCGPFPEDAGGMVVLRIAERDEALAIATRDPFVASGAQSFELRRLERSHRGNNHMGMGSKPVED